MWWQRDGLSGLSSCPTLPWWARETVVRESVRTVQSYKFKWNIVVSSFSKLCFSVSSNTNESVILILYQCVKTK